MRKTKSEAAEFKEWVCLYLGNNVKKDKSEVARSMPRVGNIYSVYFIPGVLRERTNIISS